MKLQFDGIRHGSQISVDSSTETDGVNITLDAGDFQLEISLVGYEAEELRHKLHKELKPEDKQRELLVDLANWLIKNREALYSSGVYGEVLDLYSRIHETAKMTAQDID